MPPSQPASAAARLLLGSASLFGAMALFAKAASAHIPGPQIAFVRFAAGVVVVAALAATRRISLRPRNLGWLFMRGFCGGIAVLLYFGTIEHAGVGLASLLNYTAPAWSLLFGWWLLGEPPRRATMLALLLTFAGVTLVVGPARIQLGRGALWPALGLASGVLSALALTATRAVRRAGKAGVAAESSWTVFTSFTLLGAFATAPFSFAPLGRWVTPTPRDALFLLGTAASSIAAQLFMTTALEHVTAATTGVVHQAVVVISLVGGLVVFDEHITSMGAFGSALTIAGVVAALLSASPRAPISGAPRAEARDESSGSDRR